MPRAYVGTAISLIEKNYIPEPNSGCWLWIGDITYTGSKPAYGRINYRGLRHRASRFAFMVYKGEIPEGLFVCHKCDTPLCVNPDHLFLGTPKDNVQDMMKKGRYDPPFGDRHPKAIITEEIAKQMMDLFLFGGWSRKEIADEYGVEKRIVKWLFMGHSWVRLPRPCGLKRFPSWHRVEAYCEADGIVCFRPLPRTPAKPNTDPMRDTRNHSEV